LNSVNIKTNCTDKDDVLAIIHVRELVKDAEANDVERIGRNECQRRCKHSNYLFNKSIEPGELHSAMIKKIII
jgi:hypothetical protein